MIADHLSELLYEHNCVILPGFGGFIANRLPSRMNEPQLRVEPARKVVAFNINLTQNDGLLADHIAKSRNISYDEANQLISRFVEEIRSEILLRRQSTLKGIGDFYLNSEDKIVFIPEADINFAKETYGLYPIPVRRIARGQEELKPAEKETHRSEPRPLSQPAPTRSRKWIYGAMLITLPLAIGIFTQQSGILQKADFNIGSIFNKPATENKINEASKAPVTGPSKMKEQPGQEEKKTEENIPANTPIVTPPAKEEVNIPSPQKATIVASSSFHFHVIGGSFAVAGNTQNFLASLQSKGYDAYIAGVNAHGLEMISYKGFTTEAEALLFLEKIHQGENPQAWLFNN